ncbi:hypothetical protein SANTM175S_08071 [Streptomyces antimycoticus]
MSVAREYDAPGGIPGDPAGTPGRPHIPSPARAPVQPTASDAVNEVIRWAASAAPWSPSSCSCRLANRSRTPTPHACPNRPRAALQAVRPCPASGNAP